MMADNLFIAYLTVLLLSITGGLYRFNRLGSGGKIILCLLAITFILESATRVFKLLQWEKRPIYHIETVIEAFLITYYFIDANRPKGYKYYVIVAAAGWTILEFFNFRYLQELKKMNTNVIIAESLVIIVIALHALYVLFSENLQTVITRIPHFWLSAFFLILYTGNFFFWVYVVQTKGKENHVDIVQCIQLVINSVVYFGIGRAFFLYPNNSK